MKAMPISLLALAALCRTVVANTPDSAVPACCCQAASAASKQVSDQSLYQLTGSFVDDQGIAHSLSELRGRPVVMTLFFTSCGYACPLLVSQMQAIQLRLGPTQRKATTFVLVSFDSERDTPRALAEFRKLRRLDSQWVLLRAEAEPVRELAAALGAKYRREADGQFSHSNLITLLNSQGEIVLQRQGLSAPIDDAVLALSAESR